MKARELAEILMLNPEAEVVSGVYIGGDTPQLSINNTYLELKGEKSSCYDGGHFVDTNGELESNVITLFYDPNLEK